MIKDSSSSPIQRIARLAIAIVAVAALCIAFYAAPAPEPDQPLLSTIQALSTSAAPGGELPVTDAQGLVHKRVYHLETRSFEIPGAYSLVFQPKFNKSVSVTVAMKGAFKIGLDSNSTPRIVISNVGGSQSPQPVLDEIRLQAPLAISDDAVAVTFPDTRPKNPATGENPHSISGSVEIQIGPSRAYRVQLPIKPIAQVYIGVRQIPPTFSKMLLIRRDESQLQSVVHVPESSDRGIPIAVRIIAFFIALALALLGPEIAPISGRSMIIVGTIQLILGFVIFNLSGAQAKPSGAITILCALIILTFKLFKNPLPIYLIIASAVALLFLLPIPPVIASTVCLAVIFLTLTHAFRHRKEVNRAQLLLPILLIAFFIGIEFQLQTRGRYEQQIMPMTGSRLDTWAIQRHSDIMNNHREMRGEEFRGTFVHYQKPNDTLRIIALGSSSTYGAGIGDPKQTWPTQLENIFRGDCQPSVEVVNAGWGGYNAFQLAVWLKEVLWRYNPDAVILYYGGNEDGDSRPETYYRYIRQEIDRLENPDERSIVRVLSYGTGRSSALVLFDNLSGLASYRILRKMLVRPQAPTIDEELPPPTITRSLEMMLETSKTYDFKLVLVPEIKAQGGDQAVKTLKPRITQEMKEFADANHIEFYDLTARWESVKNEAVSFDLVHFTPLGSGYLARFIADRLYQGPILRGRCTQPSDDAAPTTVSESHSP